MDRGSVVDWTAFRDALAARSEKSLRLKEALPETFSSAGEVRPRVTAQVKEKQL